jgi:hypothetical protein
LGGLGRTLLPQPEIDKCEVDRAANEMPRPEGTGARFVVNMDTAIQAEGLAGVNLALARAYKRSVYSIQYLRVEARRGGVL